MGRSQPLYCFKVETATFEIVIRASDAAGILEIQSLGQVGTLLLKENDQVLATISWHSPEVKQGFAGSVATVVGDITIAGVATGIGTGLVANWIWAHFSKRRASTEVSVKSDASSSTEVRVKTDGGLVTVKFEEATEHQLQVEIQNGAEHSKPKGQP